MASKAWDQLQASKQVHDTRAEAEPGFMCCIRCSPRYKLKMQQAATFEAGAQQEICVIPVLLGSDGTPVVSTQYSAPHTVWVNTIKNIALSTSGELWIGGIVGGPYIPPNLKAAFSSLVLQLQRAYAPRRVRDRAGAEKTCRVVCLGVMGDGQGQKHVAGSNQSGNHACRFCFTNFVTIGGTHTITPDFRAFLPVGHPMRTNARYGPPCVTPPPQHKTAGWHAARASEVRQHNENLRPFQKPRNSQGVKFDHACQGIPAFDPVLDTLTDAMHIDDNALSHIVAMTSDDSEGKKHPKHKPLPGQPRLVRRARDEDEAKYLARCIREETLFAARVAELTKINEQYSNMALGMSIRKEIDIRYMAVRALRGQRGTGSPYGTFGRAKVADSSFFIRFCGPWIYDGLGIKKEVLQCLARLFRVLRVTKLRKIPSDPATLANLSTWITEQVLMCNRKNESERMKETNRRLPAMVTSS